MCEQRVSSLKDIYIVQVLHYCEIYNQHKSCQIGLLHFLANVQLASKNIMFEEKNTVCISFSANVFVYSIYTEAKLLQRTIKHISIAYIWVNFPRIGKMVKMWHFFYFFGALLWPNGLIFSTFLNGSEEFLPVEL